MKSFTTACRSTLATVAACPYDVVKTMGRSASVEQMMAEVAGDQAYYRHFLLSRGARVVLRYSLVPGVNDSAGHLAGIAAVAARFPSLQGVEIMAYHDSGSHKALRIRRLHRLPYHFRVRRRCR